MPKWFFPCQKYSSARASKSVMLKVIKARFWETANSSCSASFASFLLHSCAFTASMPFLRRATANPSWTSSSIKSETAAIGFAVFWLHGQRGNSRQVAGQFPLYGHDNNSRHRRSRLAPGLDRYPVGSFPRSSPCLTIRQ